MSHEDSLMVITGKRQKTVDTPMSRRDSLVVVVDDEGRCWAVVGVKCQGGPETIHQRVMKTRLWWCG